MQSANYEIPQVFLLLQQNKIKKDESSRNTYFKGSNES